MARLPGRPAVCNGFVYGVGQNIPSMQLTGRVVSHERKSYASAYIKTAVREYYATEFENGKK